MRISDLARSDRAKLTLRLVLGAYVAFSALNAQAAAVAEIDVSAAFGNTIFTTYPDGRNQRVWLHEDGSWDAIGRRGKPSSGKWTLKGQQVCLKQTRPFPVPMSYCTDFPDNGRVGVEWTGKDMSGTPIRLTLQKGIQKPPSKTAP